MAMSLGMPITWLGKHTLFLGPMGPIMRWLGGMPVVRNSGQNTVEQAVTLFATGIPLILTVPAEGTRGYTDAWRSGFYHIALGAQVPIVLSQLDYSKKSGGIGPTIHATGNVVADMDQIRAFYAGRQGKYPALSGAVRLREEQPGHSQEAAPKEPS